MITYYEKRVRINRVLYKVSTILLFGLVPIFRVYKPLSVPGDLACPDEKQ